ncbi:MAG: competence protein CoiA family protein [Chlamydiota bacterium]
MARDGAETISTARALKGKTYHCPECNTPLRLRSGPHRRAHFYHSLAQKQCRQNQKTLEHLELQLKLLALFGPESTSMEHPFPEINRIADIAWHACKTVFEVQCSPISLAEAKSRCEDYAKSGYQLVWILHDKRYNQKKLSPAEAYLRTSPCYFTNVNQSGEGIIYDQFEVLKGYRRFFKGPPLEVKIDQLMEKGSFQLEDPLPALVRSRIANWPLFAAGDLLHRMRSSSNAAACCAQMIRLENRGKQVKRAPLWALIRGLYRWFLDYILGISR